MPEAVQPGSGGRRQDSLQLYRRRDSLQLYRQIQEAELAAVVQEAGGRTHGIYSLGFLQDAELKFAPCLQGSPVRRQFPFYLKRERKKQLEKSLKVLTENNKSV